MSVCPTTIRTCERERKSDALLCRKYLDPKSTQNTGPNPLERTHKPVLIHAFGGPSTTCDVDFQIPVILLGVLT